MVKPQDQMKRCIICSRNESVIRMRQIEVCFDCALDSIEPINQEHTLILELKLNNDTDETEIDLEEEEANFQDFIRAGKHIPEQLFIGFEVEDEAW